MSDVSPREAASEFLPFFEALADAARRDQELRNQLLLFTERIAKMLGEDSLPDGSSANTKLSGGVANEREGKPERQRRSRSVKDLRADIESIPAASDLKARALEWVLRARSNAVGGEELDPAAGALLQEARQIPGCKLWMIDQIPGQATQSDLEALIQCYRNVSNAARHALEFESANGTEVAPQRKLMFLMAEAQSALFSALQKFPGVADPCQRSMFTWLRERTDVFRIYLPKFMDRDQLADPALASDLGRRLGDLG